MGLLDIKPNTKGRNPDRKRTFATISISWAAYDALDKVALENNASLSATIEGLIKFHTKDSGAASDDS